MEANATHRHGCYFAQIPLRDGTTALVRPIEAGDGEAMRAMFERLSERSVYMRYHRYIARWSDEEIERFTRVDYNDRFALIAEHGEDRRIIAVVFYARLERDPARAEVAITVEDEHQGLGVAPRLIEMVARAAGDHGIGVFEADVLGENERMLSVLRKSPAPITASLKYGVVHVELPVTTATPAADVVELCGISQNVSEALLQGT